MIAVSEVEMTQAEADDYVEWVSRWQFKTLSLSVLVNDNSQPLLMPLEPFKWADRPNAQKRSNDSFSVLLKQGTIERWPPLLPVSPTKRSESGNSTFRSLLRRLKRPRP